MKKFVLLFFVGILSVSVFAQDAKRDLRNAKRALSSYGMDPTGNSGKLLEAKDLINGVVQDEEYKSSYEAWLVRGNIYNEIITQDLMMKSFNEKHKSSLPEAPMLAYESFNTAYELAEKSYQKKDASKGLAEIMNGLLAYGFDRYTENDQESAFMAFEASLFAHDIVVENKHISLLANEEDYNNQMFTVAVTALGSGNIDAADKYLNKLMSRNVEKPEIYDLLYKLYKEQGREADAIAILESGRKKYPDDTNLLFSAINQALQEGKLDALVTSLSEAIQKEPDNLSLYATLGNVYDNLFRMSEDEAEKASYFEKAQNTFNRALELNENHFETIYSLGALYYNKAAEMTQELAKLADDYSPAGLKAFDTKQKEVNEVFKEALPYFLRADQIKADDKNTLIALKEIYARLNELEKSNQYKDRLESLD
jgi:tetratricopeptide (TPR) repeat protein